MHPLRVKYHHILSNPIRIMVFVMIGALTIVMTEVFILSDNAPSVKWWETEQVSENGYGVDVATLRMRHESFLKNGIDLPETVTADNAIPEPFAITNDYTYKEQREIIDPISDISALSTIEPAVGTDTSIHNKTPYRKAEKIDDVIHNLQQAKYERDYSYEEGAPESGSYSPSEEIPTVEPKDTITYKALPTSGKIAIIIDDMGLSLRGRLVEVMEGPLTLAYLPYAEDAPKGAERALKNGHEVMVHMPMEPMSKTTDPGPHALKTDQSEEQLIQNIRWNLSQFEGFVGVNNHMGSRMTKNQAAMDVVMAELKKRDLFFIDSRTISASVAARTAKAHGLAYNQRDIFLDHEISKEFITGALEKLEKKAQTQGYAIAIGHPHKETIDALKEWIPTLKSKGLTLVKASDVLMRPTTQQQRVLEVRAIAP